MAGKTQAEPRQPRPPRGAEEEAFIVLQGAADALMQGVIELLKPSGLSPTQYNVLRILRGAGAGGRACGEVAQRMITRDPDVTRLLDRLEARGLVARTREQKDRRVIITRITPEGLGLLAGLDKPVAEFHRRRLGHMGERKLGVLIGLLRQAREGHI